MNSNPPIIVDPEFAALIPPLTREEDLALTGSIRGEGCRDSLIVWRTSEGDILLDGHNRYRICTLDKLPYRTTAASTVQNRDEAYNWIISNQLARRNLTPDQISYLRGKRYNGSKVVAPFKGNQHSGGGQIVHHHQPTAERLAGEYKVTPRTIRRDGEFAEAVDTLAETVGPEAKKAILAGDSPLPKQDIIAVAQATPAEQHHVLAITDKPAILAAARQIKEQQAAERRQARDSDLTEQERKAREDSRRWREDGEVGKVIDRLYAVVHSTSPEHAAGVMIQFGLTPSFIQLTADMVEESATWLRGYSRQLREHLGTQSPLRKVE